MLDQGRWYSVHFLFVIFLCGSGIYLYGTTHIFPIIKGVVLQQWVSITRDWSGQKREDASRLVLLEENRVLREQLQVLSQQLGQVVLLREENRQLTKLLELQQHSSELGIVARVVYQRTKDTSLLTYVDKGTQSGVQEGMTVALYTDTQLSLLGHVKRVFSGLAELSLLSEHHFQTLGYVGDTYIIGLIKGRGADEGLLQMEYIPNRYRSEVQIGDRVFTMGSATSPAGLLIGEVQSIEDHHHLYFTVFLEPSSLQMRWDYVFLIRGGS